ncbi:hypothetical protein OS493_037661 [Desmophyllum pertusum]|uniref:Uncharacterized protein n=1 Tax=Desmophyllum pertusum TaxID=174260 RepID=A0A9X0D197_9CNID|nr:hypothetical protein OS493_037661 [Desmophyllum pertusum]
MPGVCPNNWVHMQGSCYKYFSKALNWNAAKSACEKLGSKLVVINSQAEQQALGSKITSGQSTWIGLYTNPKDKSRWLWVDGTRPTYTHWSTGEPNGLHEECAEMYTKKYGWRWNDDRSSSCQKLSLRSGVRVSPSNCLSSNQKYGSTCSFSCARGYRLSGPSSSKCGLDGAWSAKVNTVICNGVCPNNWVHMQGSCYKFSYKALNWNAAKSACETLGSKLVVINSQAEQRAIISKITGSQLTWIGLHRDPKDKSRWLWVDGTRPTYTNWNPREPSSVGEECGHLWPNYGWKWNDWTCTNSLPYVCETPIGVCPNNWVHMQGSCYKYFSKALNWNAAKSACEKLGSKLVVINSQAEQQALGSKITSGQSTWIGLYTNPKDKSRWLWVDGTRPTYTHWSTGEPNGLHEECAEMYTKKYGWRWNDDRCTTANPYICEIPLGVCPNNWVHMQGSCYKFSYKALNWNAAKSACETLGSKLVVINSQAEQRAIISKITGSQLNLDGLHRDPKDKSRWLWVDGTRPTYTNWNPREPSSVGEECGHLWPNYGWKWNDWTCTNSLPYVCETPIGVCPNNWVHMQGSCYKFISQAVNWNAAKSACETLGSKLVVINSQAEQQAISSKLPDAQQRTWIGLYRDPKDKSRWLWVDGTRPTYTYWNTREPSSLREECGEMYPKRSGRKWNDVTCTASFPYICETPGGTALMIFKKSRDKPAGYAVVASGDPK